MPHIKQLEGKPLTISLEGKTRKLGMIEFAQLQSARTRLVLEIKVTDEEIAGILGAAQDKAEAAASPIGLTDQEISDILSSEVE